MKRMKKTKTNNAMNTLLELLAAAAEVAALILMAVILLMPGGLTAVSTLWRRETAPRPRA